MYNGSPSWESLPLDYSPDYICTSCFFSTGNIRTPQSSVILLIQIRWIVKHADLRQVPNRKLHLVSSSAYATNLSEKRPFIAEWRKRFHIAVFQKYRIKRLWCCYCCRCRCLRCCYYCLLPSSIIPIAIPSLTHFDDIHC